MGPGPWALGHGPCAMGNGPWAMGHGPWAMGPGPWALGPGPWAMGHGPWAAPSKKVIKIELQNNYMQIEGAGAGWGGVLITPICGYHTNPFLNGFRIILMAQNLADIGGTRIIFSKTRHVDLPPGFPGIL